MGRGCKLGSGGEDKSESDTEGGRKASEEKQKKWREVKSLVFECHSDYCVTF